MNTKVAEITLSSVTDWKMEITDDHRCPVPAMSQAERDEWKRLGDIEKWNRQERSLYRALCRKMEYRGKREIEVIWQ